MEPAGVGAGMFQDLRFAFRLLARQPGFTAAAVLTLAIGIGANSALFTLVDRVLLSPLPFAHPGRLVILHETDLPNQITRGAVSGPNFLDWRLQGRSFEALAAADFGGRFNLSGKGEPASLRAARVTPDFFDVFEWRFVLGRPFELTGPEAEDGRWAVLSYTLWQRRFAGATNVLGQALTLDGEPFVVVGVAGRTLSFVEELVDVYVPVVTSELRGNRGSHYFQVFGRLRPGVTVQEAGEELRVIAAGIAAANPELGQRSAVVNPLHAELVESVRPAFLVLYGAVALVLFIACANVANLLLARGATRARELAVRASLGAGRWRIVRQLLTESVVLGMGGGGLGLLLASTGLAAVRSLAPRLGGMSVPFIAEAVVDGRALLFTLVCALVTGLLFGLAPALQAVRPGLVQGLRESGLQATGTRRRHRLLDAFVVGQIALSVVLLASAGYMVRSFWALVRVHPGFEPAQLLTMVTDLSYYGYRTTDARRGFYEALLERVRGLPGVESADVASMLPLSNSDVSWSFEVEGEPGLEGGRQRLAEYRLVSAGFFETLRIPLRSGRGFSASDGAVGRGVVIISESAERRYFGGGTAMGRRLRFSSESPWLEVVGVVGDVKHFGLDREAPPVVYQPLSQGCDGQMSLVVRARGNPAAQARAVQQAVWAIDPGQAVTGIRTMSDWLEDSVSVPRFSARLLVGVALTGLVLAAIGIYGVLAYSVSQQTREIGLRLALGATRAQIMRLVLERGARLVGWGLLLGVAGALGVGRLLRSLLFEMRQTDPWVFLGTLLVLASVAFLACYVPARRAAGLDPMAALRQE